MTKFGPAGNGASFYAEGFKRTVQMPEWLKNKGLDCFEYSLGRGVTIGESSAREIGAKAAEFGVEMSVHAPYYINFANPDAFEKSAAYIFDSLKILKAFGGNRLVFHVGSPLKLPRKTALAHVETSLKKIAETVGGNPEFRGIRLCPETMGKLGQIGSADEIIGLCKIDGIYTPCIDFGHLNAREQGALAGADDYRALIEKYLDALGDRAAEMHVHFSRVEYGAAGEIRHLTFADDKFGPYFEHLAPVLIENKMNPYIICESDGTQAEDALKMKEIFLGKVN
ncbi:MAG: TIM barrel protein [Clostridiales bacterium]|jgi:deoxyribonuclease-4|nr:TIM barrel protein [Clostridiales bacterium]